MIKLHKAINEFKYSAITDTMTDKITKDMEAIEYELFHC